MKYLSNISAVIISAAIFTGLSATAFAENALTLGDPTSGSSRETKRLTYTGEKAAFSVDIPAEYCGTLELSDGEPKEVGDGSTEWALFFGESETGYVSCAFHESEGGFEGEKSIWSEMENVQLFEGTDADGQPFCVAEMGLDGFSAYLAEFPMGEDSWVNITLSFPESEMEAARDDVLTMMNNFTRDINAANADEEPAEPVPETGVELFPIAAPAAAAAMFLTKKRR